MPVIRGRARRCASQQGNALFASVALGLSDDMFLRHRLYRRTSDGEIMNPQFVRLHYPCYWRHDVLFALNVMAEGGFIRDPRCTDALELLESKCLPDAGWAAEERFYRTSADAKSGVDLVAWGRSAANDPTNGLLPMPLPF